MIVEQAIMETIKPLTQRCNCCRKKLTLTATSCRCGFKFCDTHRLPEEHACTYDFNATGKAALSTMLVAVVGNKLHNADVL